MGKENLQIPDVASSITKEPDPDRLFWTNAADITGIHTLSILTASEISRKEDYSKRGLPDAINLKKRIKFVAADLLGEWFGRGLTPHAKEFFKNEAIEKIKKGEKITLSQLTPLLEGYKYDGENTEGLDVLGNLKEKGILIIGNHSPCGLLKGFAHEIVIAHHVKSQTEKEVCWVQGKANRFTRFAHEMVATSINSVYVGEKNPRAGVKILGKLNDGEVVGIFPEGEFYSEVGEPDPKMGGLILAVAKRAVQRDGIAIVTASTYFDDKGFHTHFSQMSPENIRKESQIMNEKVNFLTKDEQHIQIGHGVARFAMWEVAKRLPSEKQGFYKYYKPYTLQ